MKSNKLITNLSATDKSNDSLSHRQKQRAKKRQLKELQKKEKLLLKVKTGKKVAKDTVNLEVSCQ